MIKKKYPLIRLSFITFPPPLGESSRLKSFEQTKRQNWTDAAVYYSHFEIINVTYVKNHFFLLFI